MVFGIYLSQLTRYFDVMFHNIPIEVFSNDIPMLVSQMTLNITFAMSFIRVANQAIVTKSFVHLVVSV